MTSIFSRIIAGELPARLIWSDEHCVAMLDVRPLAPGHVLVIPREEIDHWIDLSPELAAHLTTVAHHIGRAQQAELAPARIGLMIAGFEIPHTHLHVVPMSSMANLDFSNADSGPEQAELDTIADRLRARLRADGHAAVPD